MTEDTKRALEAIKPLADELGITLDADDKILYVDNIGIGIAYNSTWATLMEFIGYLFLNEYDALFRNTEMTVEQNDIIRRFWIGEDLLKRMKEEDR